MDFSFLPFSNFDLACQEVLQFLYSRTEFGLWMVTRTNDEDWIVLAAEDHGYDVQPGDIFRWDDSFCSRMVKGLGPRVAPDSNQIAAYASAPIGQQVPIGAYIGIPLSRSDGSLFGTICAINKHAVSEEIRREQKMFEIMARLLSTIVEKEMMAEEQARLAERALSESMIDGLTAIYNRRGWDRLVEIEQRRCHRYGHAACVISIDLDGLKQINDTRGHAEGDRMIKSAAQVLTAAIRDTDVLARLGGDEFGILAVECGLDEATSYVNRIKGKMAAAGISASIGYQICRGNSCFFGAFDEADQNMYEEKRSRKSNLTLPNIEMPLLGDTGRPCE